MAEKGDRCGGPITVLYVEGSASTADLVGGSIVSLYILARALDRRFVRPVVLFTSPNRFVPRFQEAGIEVRVLNHKIIRERETTQSLSAAIQRTVVSAGPLQRAYRLGSMIFRLCFEFFPRALSVYREIRRSRASLVHANDRIGSTQFVVLAARMAGVPCIVHERMISEIGPIERMISRWVSASIVVSENLRDLCVAAGLRTREIRVIPNAVDLEAARRAAAAAPPATPGSPSIVLVGRLVPWKGHLPFLASLALARKEIPGLHASLVGGANEADQGYRREIEATIERLGLSGAVTITGYVDDVLPHIAAADILVHASIEPEPFGRVIIEGMAVGRPVIATAHGAPPEIIKHAENGLLVPPADPEAMAGAILRLLKDRREAERIAEAGRRTAEEKYSEETHRQRVENLYREVIDKARTRGR